MIERPYYYPTTPDHEKAGVYAIVCEESGAMYVGATVRFEKRWEVHLRALEEHQHWCKPLQDSYNSSLFDYLTLAILEIYTPRWGRLMNICDIYPLEIRWMQYYRGLGCLCNGKHVGMPSS